MAVVDRDGRLVGRDSALGTAGAALDDALAGAGQLLLITGEPGIGKSALLTEVARRAARRGAHVLRGSCWDGAGAPPYWPWTQVLRGIDPGSVEFGEANRLLSREAAANAASAHEAADARFRLFDGVASLLARQAGTVPLVVLLDDLQWADGPSLQLLEFITSQLATQRVLLLGAFRDTEAAHALHRLGGQVLPLAGLNAAEVGALITVVAGSRPSSERAEAVWRRCAGNPFFVRELTRLVLARGGWDQAAGSAFPIPDSVRATLTERLGRLSRPCGELLMIAAVAWPAVRLDMLTRVSGLAPDIVADLLDEAVRARVVVLDGGARIAHDLFREAILATLPSARRAALHAAVGLALQDLAGGPTTHDLAAVGGAAALAAHFVAGGPSVTTEARKYSILAAQEATARLGHEDAVRHYDNALRLLPEEPSGRVELLLAKAAASDRTGDPHGARAAYRHVAVLARANSDAPALARAALGIHSLGSRAGADDRECADLLADAAARLRQDPSTPGPALERATLALRSGVLAALARMHRHSSRPALNPLARAAAREAVELAESAADPAALAVALLAVHDVAWEHGSAPRRLPIIAAMATAAQQADDRDLVAEAKLLQAAALIELGDPAGRAELVQYTQLADSLGHVRGRWGALSRRATLAELAGRVDEAVELSDAALDLGRKVGIPDAVGCFSTLRGSLAALGASMPLVDEVLPETDPLWPVFPLLRAWSMVHNGDRERAAGLMRGFAIQDIVGKYDLELLAVAAIVCAAVGSQSQREWVYAQLEPHPGLHAVIGGCAAYHGAVDHFLGLLATALRRTEQASEHFAAAIAMHERLGTLAWAELSRRARDRLQSAAPANVFRNDGGTWRLVFDGHEAHLPDAKGLHDIATLLAAPGRDIHVFTLLGIPVPPTGADLVLDEQAKTQYAARLAQLDVEIAKADAHHDPHRSERACAERDAIIHELTAAAGLGRRRRRLGDQAEKARKTVGARIRDVLGRIERVHPQLAEHLRDTITTGTTCAYTPLDDCKWFL
jgi:tetratricopeptide (TPR) repeat protein